MKKKRLSLMLLIPLLLAGCHNYEGWEKVEIPTDTPLKGKIKIPQEWEFISEDGIITLINQTNNTIIAEQVYQEWRFIGWHGKTSVDNWDDLKFKTNLDDVDYKNEDYYEFTRNNSSGAYIYTFNDGVVNRLCLSMEIYLDLAHPACDSKTGVDFGGFYLLLMFDEFIDIETIQQMADSYIFGGTINQKK